MENKLRLIGGQWRSRQLHFQGTQGLRPTPARVRETLFNWLQYDILGSRCLDLYAGSGALGFEAASRGAQTVIQVENNPLACQSLLDNARLLGARQLDIQAMDVLAYLGVSGAPFDIVFLDPPFGQGLAQTTCQLLERHNWLGGRAKIYVETEKRLRLDGLPNNWGLIKHKVAGAVAYRLFCREAS